MNLRNDEDLKHLVKSIAWKLYLFDDYSKDEYYKETWREFKEATQFTGLIIYQILESIWMDKWEQALADFLKFKSPSTSSWEKKSDTKVNCWDEFRRIIKPSPNCKIRMPFMSGFKEKLNGYILRTGVERDEGQRIVTFIESKLGIPLSYQVTDENREFTEEYFKLIVESWRDLSRSMFSTYQSFSLTDKGSYDELLIELLKIFANACSQKDKDDFEESLFLYLKDYIKNLDGQKSEKDTVPKGNSNTDPIAPIASLLNEHQTDVNQSQPKMGDLNNAVAPSKAVENVEKPKQTIINPPPKEPPHPVFKHPKSLWQYKPVEVSPFVGKVIDKRDDVRVEFADLTKHLKIAGASVRGRSHKHEGTYCDDWFEFKSSGEWTIIAVSDGAGSCKLSRLGSKVSCEVAAEYLASRLSNHTIQPRNNKDEFNSTFIRETETGFFVEQDVRFVQDVLYESMEKAYEAIKKEVEILKEKAAYDRYINENNDRNTHRDLNIKDLSATLLLVVYTTINFQGNSYGLGLTCQVGDGMIALISSGNNEMSPLARPDAGEFSGQTEFLTSKGRLEKARLVSKTFPYLKPLQALMVMTDGISDVDGYFSNDSGMLNLYGDLVLNNIINLPKPTDELIQESLSKTQLKSIQEVEDAISEFQILENFTIDGNPNEANIRYIDLYAEKLGCSPSEVSQSNELLWVGANVGRENSIESQPLSSDKLKIWLDAFYKKQAHDDRTLVILYRDNSNA